MEIALLIRVDCPRGASCTLLATHQTKIQPGFVRNAVKTHYTQQSQRKRNIDTHTQTLKQKPDMVTHVYWTIRDTVWTARLGWRPNP